MQSADWAPHGAYPCRGIDEWIAISIQDDSQWASLVTELNTPDWAQHPRFAKAIDRKANEDDLDQLMAEAAKNLDRYDLMHRLQNRGVPAAAVQKADDRCERDPQLKARDYLRPLPHSEIGTWQIEGFPATFEKILVDVGGLPHRGAPMMGEDNDHVYREVLGLTAGEIAALREDWVI
jgi:crotonobetainyl-CoA:carnitine CoA-transferase CaiB-like acyl-CoA transferase